MEGSSLSVKFLLLLLHLLVSRLFINLTLAARDPASKASTEFIRSSCTATTYPELCFSSLSAHASTIQESPELLVKTALNVTTSTAKSTAVRMVKLCKSQGLKRREVGALKDCVEELRDAVDELRKSLSEMRELEEGQFQLLMSDIQTWVSAALTDESTCTDGFEGKSMDGNVKATVREQIITMAHLTSNALSLINRYADIHG